MGEGWKGVCVMDGLWVRGEGCVCERVGAWVKNREVCV